MSHRAQASRSSRSADPFRSLERGREHYRLRAWTAAYQSFSSAAEHAVLGAQDLEQLAISAYLAGHDADYLRALE